MRNKRQLLIQQLDNKLKPLQEMDITIIPIKGWIHTIRTAFNMTLAQLGTKLEITRQGVKKIEESENKGSISINSLIEVGRAMDLKFVYGFIPREGSFENLINTRAQELAKKIVLRTHQNMNLEGQSMGVEKITETIEDLAMEIRREMRKSLWD